MNNPLLLGVLFISAEYIYLFILVALCLIVVSEIIGRIWWIIGIIGGFVYYIRNKAKKSNTSNTNEWIKVGQSNKDKKSKR